MAEATTTEGRGAAPGARAPLPKTGQTKCWDKNGKDISCTGTGQDGDLRKGNPWGTPRFKKNNDGTVTDTHADLIWTQDANLFGEVVWEDALANARKLASGRF